MVEDLNGARLFTTYGAVTLSVFLNKRHNSMSDLAPSPLLLEDIGLSCPSVTWLSSLPVLYLLAPLGISGIPCVHLCPRVHKEPGKYCTFKSEKKLFQVCVSGPPERCHSGSRGRAVVNCPIRGAAGTGGWGETPPGRGLLNSLQTWLWNALPLS